MQMIEQVKINVMVGSLLLALASGLSPAQAANILVWEFEHSPQPGVQYATASAVDSQGNLIITGYTDRYGDNDFYTVKVRSNDHAVLWEARYDHPLSDDLTAAVAVDGNDDVIVAGHVFNGVNTDIAIIKYDGVSGLPAWPAPYILNGDANGNDAPLALAVDGINNIYVAGFSHHGGSTADDAILFKLTPDGPNPDGSPIWQVHYNGALNGDDRFNRLSVGATGIALTGHSAALHGGGRQDFDYLTMKVDLSGNVLWQKTYDHGSGSDVASFSGMDAAGNVIVSGKVMAGNREDMFTIKYAAADGAQLWATAYSAGSPNLPGGLVVDSDGEVYVTGNTFTTSGKVDFYTARYRGTDGVPVWQQVFDSGLDNSDKPSALALDQTGGLYVTGVTHKALTGDDDFQTIKYNKTNGNQIWQQTEDGTPVGGDQQPVGVAVALSVTADGNVYVAGWSQDVSDVDFYAVKYSAALLNSPTGLSATVVSQNQVDLTWQDNSNAPNNEDSFCVERCQGFGCSDYSALPCVVVGQDQTSYSDSTVSRDQWYSYRVKGQSAALGDSLPGGKVSVMTTLINYPAPLWLYTHDTEGLDDAAHAIATGGDNNPVATGMSATLNSQYDYYTVKLDRANAAIPFWIDSYDGPDGQGDVGVCLAVDSNDDVVVSGFSSIDAGLQVNTNDIFTIKYAAAGPDPYTGEPLWAVQYNGPGNDDDRSTAVASAADGSNFTAVTGYGKNAAGNEDIYLIKYKPDYDAASQQVWAITPYDGGFNDFPETTAFTPEGDVVVVGTTYNATDSDIFISKYRGADGGLLSGWPYVHNFGYGADRANAVAVAGDGSIYVAGHAMNAAGNLDIYVNKFNAAGIPQWGNGKIIDGAGHGYDEAHAIAIDPNDGDVVVGATITSDSGSNDFHVLRYQADGTLRWQRTLEQIGHDEMLVGMALSPSGEICLAGETEDGVDTDVIAVKYDHLGNLIGSTKFDNGFDDFATAITVNRLGEFYIAGYSATGQFVSDDYDFVVFRFNGQELQSPSPLAVVTHNTTVDLSWVENDTEVSGYKLYRKSGVCTDGGSSFEPATLILTAAPGTTAWTDSGLNIGSTYCYGLMAFRTATSEVSRLIERQVTTTVPLPPDNLVALVRNTSEVEVCWHDNSASEDGFTVQRCAGADCDFTQVTTINAPAELDAQAAATCIIDTSACDSGAGKTFRYRVQAFRGVNGNEWRSAFSAGSPSDTAAVPVLMAPSLLHSTAVAEARVALQWTDNTVDETEFSIERCTGATCNDADFSEVGTVSPVMGNALLLELDEASVSGAAGELADASGHGLAATAFGGVVSVADGHSGRAVHLDGVNDYLSAPLVIDQSSGSAGVTMMAWVKPSSESANYHYLFSTEDGSAAQVRNSWGLVRYYNVWYVATGNNLLSTGVTVANGQWQHVAVVFSPATPSTGVRLYINGVQQAVVNTIAPHDSSAHFTVGRQGVLNQNYFDGAVDEVAVFGRPLSAAEIQAQVATGVFPEALKWFTDTTVSHSTDYQYRIKARKQTACGTDLSAPSNANPVTTVPLPPQPLAASLVRPGVVSLTWSPQTTTQTGFLLERCNGAGCTDFAEVSAAITASAKKYADRTACRGGDGVSRYRIRALGPWGQSAPSAVAEVVSGIGPSPTNPTVSQVTEASVTLRWNYVDASRDGFVVERCDSDQATCAQSNNFAPVAGSPTTGYDPALQGLWQMDDALWSGAAGEVTDSSGNNHHGTAQNGASLDTPGHSGYGAALFDGTDDVISTDLLLDQSPTSAGATVMAWVYPSAQTGSYQYVFSTDNGGADWGLFFYSSYWYVDNGSGPQWGMNASLNTWQHVAVVFDPNTGIRIYSNGVLQNTIAGVEFEASSAPILLGGHPGGNSRFTGKMDEVAVFNRPLTSQEVSEQYNHSGPIAFTDASTVSTGGTYTYRIKPLFNTACGDWDAFAAPVEVTASTPLAPVAPDSLTVTRKSSTQIDLTWQSKTSSESAFLVERCQGAGCDFSTMDSVQLGAGVTHYSDTSVCQGLTYRYRVKAVKGGVAPWEWETAYAGPAEQSTAAATPVALSLDVVNESEIALSFNDANADEDAYQVSRCLVVPGVTACDQAAQFTPVITYPGSVNGALLHYRLDEASWTGAWGEVLDASGLNNHGGSYNGAALVDGGRFGRAASFNGTNSFVYSPLMINQGRNSAGVTMEAWVYPTMTDANPRSVLSTENGGYDWGVIVQNGTWQVNTGLSQVNTGLAVQLNTWQHITAVFTPLVGIKFYKDSEVVTINEIDYDLSQSYFQIARNGNSSSSIYYFQGLVDEVLVYGRPLTAAEVTAHNTYQESPAYSYLDSGLQPGGTYHYRVTASKAAGCGWQAETTVSATTPAPSPPTALTVTAVGSTSCSLTWQDNSGSETGYVLSRCEGGSGDCPSPVLVNLPADSTSFSDATLCPGQIYTYRVWAVGGWGQTTFNEAGLTTIAQSATPAGLTASWVSEVEVAISWDYQEMDESGVILKRCAGASCVDLNLAPGSKAYADNELSPNTEYCYQVSVFKTAACGWQTAWAGPACVTTSLNGGVMTATPVNTTTVAVAWTDPFQTETASVVERCAGDVNTCCAGDPANCPGAFSAVGTAPANQNQLNDDSACAGATYTYRVNSKGEGLSRGNTGCWTRRAPLTFTSFAPFSGLEVLIPHQAGMRNDFADLRFYDSTGHRELQYWIKDKTPGVSATVWLMTGANPAITLYYGNPLATDSSATDALFTEVYDQFQGNTINDQKWVVLDTAADKITQGNGLIFTYKDQNQDAAVFSTKTFERAAGNELFIDFTVGSDVQWYRYETFLLGWGQDQTVSAAVSGNAAHLLSLNSQGNHYAQTVYEDAAALNITRTLYGDLTRYQLKIVLNGGGGAKYYLKGGAFADWRLLTETSTSRPDDDVLRIAFLQASHNITVHQVIVKHASAQRGAAVNFAAVEGDGVACLNLTHTWVSSPAAAVQATLAQASAPSGLSASVNAGRVELAWTPGTGDESEFLVERDCGAGYEAIGSTAGGGGASYSDAAMPLSTPCAYQVRGHKAGACPWTSDPSNAAQVLAPPAGPVLTITAENAFQVRLDWSDAADEEGYDVEAQVFSGAWMPVASLPANQISHTDSHGVNPSSQYTYRVRARRGNGNSAWGQASVTTPAYTPGAATCPVP